MSEAWEEAQKKQIVSHDEMIAIQSDHRLMQVRNFKTKEKYVLYLTHAFAYLQASRLAKNKRVLDLGCNNGYGSAMLFHSAKKVTSVDVSQKAIEAAQAQYNHLPVEFKIINGKQLPFDDNEFDLVVSFQVIEHIIDYNLYLNELKRVLAPGGAAVFTTPNAQIRLFPGMKPWNRFHVREFSPSELKIFLKSFFPAVQVIGLFAKEPIYSIEINRVDRKRKEQRMTEVAKENAPAPITENFGNDIEIEQFINEYGVKDLFYSFEDLNNSMDLLAICSDDKNIPAEMIAQIKIKK